MGGAAAMAIMRKREREIVDDFRAAGATSAATAQSYTAVGIGESFALRRLHDRAVIREAAPATYYLDEGVWTAVQNSRRRIALVMLLVVVILLVGTTLGTFKW